MTSKRRVINIISISTFLDLVAVFFVIGTGLTLCLIPIIIALTPGGVEKATYRVSTNTITGDDDYLTLINNPSIAAHKQVTNRENELLKQWSGQVEWTGLAALLGWGCTSIGFRKGLVRLLDSIKNKLP